MESILERLRAAIPADGLFADKEWILSPAPFPLEAPFVEQLEKLGHRLNLFSRACNELYHRSVAGKQPAWIADYLDRGKPAELVELSRQGRFRQDVPLVIRPDLVLTEEGFTIAEVDSVPGGIGLTAWLNETYAALGFDVLGGARGMIEGFNAVLGGDADILVSEEAATYRPEMAWLARASGASLRVHRAEDFTLPEKAGNPDPARIYRFFELFDLPNIRGISDVLTAAAEGRVRITPPLKPYLEEKLWFALFWLRPLRDFWRRELSERHFLELQKHIPYTWLLDPQPIPHHAVIPGLEINDWRELAAFGQKHRELIVKISGFHATAWGSRGVELGSDLSQGEWQAALDHAATEFPSHPHILQRFHKGRLFDQPYFDLSDGSPRTMRGRVRLCPYYFVLKGRAELRGALATICPPDKKLLHGMKDAILVPASVAAE